MLGIIEQPVVVCSRKWRASKPRQHSHCLSQDQIVESYYLNLESTNVGNGSILLKNFIVHRNSNRIYILVAFAYFRYTGVVNNT